MSSGQAEIDQLREVLIGDHLNQLASLRANHANQIEALHERIAALEATIRTDQQRSTLVGEVLTNAVRFDRPTGELGEALQPDVEHAISTSARGDSAVLAEALYPVLGPAIRKMVANMLTPDSLREGRTFTVEQLMLIERETGLVLAASALDESKLENADVVSGMMDAIRRFVQEAFDADDHDGLRDLRVGDTSVIVEWGPRAVLAAVVSGVPDEEFRVQSAVTLENIHRDFEDDLQSFSGDLSPFAGANEQLANFHGATEARSSSRKMVAFLAAIFVLIIIAVIVVWALNR